MDLVKHLQRLFDYDAWANQEVLKALKQNNGPERSIKLLAHIFAAERLWLERLQGQDQSVAVWPSPSLAECEAEARRLSQLFRKYLEAATEDSLHTTITYTNSKGEPWTSEKHDVLQHVIMHSAYHRGQIAADTRANGAAPAYTDYIHAVRQHFIE